MGQPEGILARIIHERPAALDGDEPIDFQEPFESLGDGPAVAAVCWDMVYLMVWMARGAEGVDIARRGLKTVSGGVSLDRCRLLAIGGWALGNAAERSDEVLAGDEMQAESLTMAEMLDDSGAHRAGLLSDAYKHFLCMRSDQQAEVSLRAAELFRSAGDPWNTADVLTLFQLASLFRGDLEDVNRFEQEVEPLVQRLGHVGAELFALWAAGLGHWMRTASLDEYERSSQRCVDVCTKANMSFRTIYENWMVLARIWRGQWESARDVAADLRRREPPGVVTGQCWSSLFLCECLLGHRETALALLEDRRRYLPPAGRPSPSGAWMMLFRVIEGLSVLDELEAAAELYPSALEAIETGTAVGWDADHLLQTVAGMAAACGRRWDQAESHYQEALRQAHAIPFRSEQPEVRRWYARMLLDRNAPGDRDKAGTFLGEATEMYRTIGMPKHLEMVEKMFASL